MKDYSLKQDLKDTGMQVLVGFGALVAGCIGKLLAHEFFAFIPPSWFAYFDLLVAILAVGLLIRLFAVQSIRAVFLLTWKAAFRFRLFWVLAGLLLASVVLLPLLIKDDGTARGFIQIMLTYTLSVITVLLGFSTLWLACGTLARDIEDCSMQMVAVKPIARWQIWLGKWLGVILLNACLLAVSGAAVYGLLHWRLWRMEQARNMAAERKDERLAAFINTQVNILRNEIFVARASLKEPPPDIEGEVLRQMERVPNRQSLTPDQLVETTAQLRERVRAFQQVVGPDHRREWVIDFGLKRHLIGGGPLFLRVKFYAAQTNGTGLYLGNWTIGPYDSPVGRSYPQSLAANTYHEIRIENGMGLLNDKGQLVINFINRNDSTLIFPLDDGLEVLYREGGFTLNYCRGLSILWCWLALLATLGLASGSLLSFPVAAFCSISLLLVALSSGTLAATVQEGTVLGADHEGGSQAQSWLDIFIIPLFKAILGVVNLVQAFSPVDALSTGRSITWGQLAQAFGQIVLLLGGILGLLGVWCFTRRELATAQGNS